MHICRKKKSQRNNMCFDLTLQTKNRTNRSVCFFPEKHPGLSSNYESSSQVKISKFQLKRNQRSYVDAIHINKRSKLEDQQEEKCRPGITAVSDVLEGDCNAAINVCGRITLHGAQETILSKGRHSQSKKPYLPTIREQRALCHGQVT